MSNLRVGAIIPVKTFSRAKSRLTLPPEKKETICRIMLESVLGTVTRSEVIEKTVIVSKDEAALGMGKRFGATGIYDGEELGVNHAVRLADDHLKGEGFDLTIVFPQDIPLIQGSDIQSLLSFRMPGRFVLVVPSRKFDGTNALVRRPVDVMETHYDEDSYKIHLENAERKGAHSALILIQRVMLDVDDEADLYIIKGYDLQVSKSIRDALV